jgi:hypothetical protein
VVAAGATLQALNGDIKKPRWQIGVDKKQATQSYYEAFLFVNNFSGEKQLEASEQASEGSIEGYTMFDSFIQKALSNHIPMGFLDNKYANGGDIWFVNYMADRTDASSLLLQAYAGWNTNGKVEGNFKSVTHKNINKLINHP